MKTKIEKVLDPHVGVQFTIPGDLAVYTIKYEAGIYSVRNKYGSLEALVCQHETNEKVMVLKKSFFGANITRKVLFENIEWLGKEVAA